MQKGLLAEALLSAWKPEELPAVAAADLDGAPRNWPGLPRSPEARPRLAPLA